MKKICCNIETVQKIYKILKMLVIIKNLKHKNMKILC